MADVSNFVIDQGTTFSAVISVTGIGEDLFNLTGFDIRGEFKKSHYTEATNAIACAIYGDPVNGQIEITIGPDATEGIRAGRYVYDIIVEDVSINYVKRVLEGVLTITPATTALRL